MYVRIREISTVSKSDSRVNDLALNISKTALIQELRQMIAKELDIEEEKQCLYYMGKLLVDDHRIVDYNIKLNDVIQLTVKIKTEDVSKSTIVKEENSGPVPAQSLYYKIGDKVDFRDLDNGYWFEAKITKITCDRNIKQPQESDLRYKVEIDRGEEIDYAKELTSDDIRPRAWYTYPMSELKENMIVLANYNIEEPKKRGFWFHLKIQKVERNTINGVLMLAPDSFLDNCTVIYPKEVMKIPEPVLITDREDDHPDDIPLRKVAYYCEYCRDDLKRKCKHCGCKVCSLKTNPKTLLLCDDCDIGYHMACLDPPITEFPEEDEWYCPACKIDRDEIVQPGKKLKPSAKRSKMPSNSKTTNKDRDWGKGMACVGRTTECTIVPKNHYGPVPGVEVGTRWKFRMQVSEAGIHRAPVAGIHGREKDGAYSIVLSRGYEDDVDNGEEFYYTGSGGRDLSGNKRVSGQSCDQELTRENKALALNCNVKFSNTGAEAADWRKGKPVRVVRDSKLGKHSKYAPKDGYRYDGIYKVVKYFSQTGKSGHLVWRYLMRRDDPAPAPWTKKGQELDVIYPPGYKDALEAKNKDKTKQEDTDDENSKKSSNTRNKRKVKSADVSSSSSAPTPPSPKKPKLQRPVPYEISEELTKLIEDDAPNEKVWKELRESTNEGKQKFLAAVEEAFRCVCCQEVVYKPITTECKHNVCKSCLKRSFAAEIYVCPTCRFDLGKDYSLKVNTNLGTILETLFPGYEAAR